VEFSFFFFADNGDAGDGGYRLLMEGARFADTHGFAAVWTPERHFHRFGGPFANPSVTAAAIAAITTRVGVRAGSVVWPLHHPLRVAEEWAMVDNLSGGRSGLSLASGWHPNDFVLRPEGYQDRRRLTVDGIDLLRRLWRGEPYTDTSGIEYRISPRPARSEPRLWLTSGGSAATFEAAGKSGVGVLTHLLSHPLEKLAGKVALYRQGYAASGHPGRGHVVLMVHTYLDEDFAAAERQAREPLTQYLISSLELGVRSPAGTTATMNRSKARLVVAKACQRYLRQDGLFGSVADALPTVRRIEAADVDEIACLIDFGVPVDAALAGLRRIDQLRRAAAVNGEGPR
jgi:natural product biosynthesis luciferase-like monooxygenase protein